MNIKIGPYINRWTTTNFEDWWMEMRTAHCRWELDDEDYEPIDNVVIWICDKWQTVLNYTVNQYLDRKKRRIKIQLHDYDTWSMDHTLSLIILPMLKQLTDTKHGSPVVDDDDVPDGLGLRSTEALPVKDQHDDANLHKRWDWVMNELIWTFEQLVNDNDDDQFHTGTIDIKWTPVDKDGNEIPEEESKLYRMDKGPKDTHVFDKVGYDKHQKRIDNGLRLFGKYFRGLWT